MKEPMQLGRRVTAVLVVMAGFCFGGLAQPVAERDVIGPVGFGGPPPGFMPGGPGPFGGPGPGPGMREGLKILKKFDRDGSGWLNTGERQEARKFVEQENAAGRGRGSGPFGGPGGRMGGPPGQGRFGRDESVPRPGIRITPAEAKSGGEAPLYDPNVLRTLFLQFDSPDWEQELETFRGTDVDVAATLIVDGRTYRDVGVRFRGNTSYMMVGTGRKRPLNISMDMAHGGQELMGFRTLNLLNAHEDPSFLHPVLAMQMARDYLPAPRANFVRLVINGENWGVYPNLEQFNKDFLRDNFGTTKGVRWKVPGNPGARGGLEYLGEEVGAYRRIYEIMSREDQKAWLTLMNLCKVLNETPARDLPTQLAPFLNVDGALRFLAWDNVLAGGDGFWTRASDYCLYEDPRARFHLVPYDVNETFSSSGGGPGGPGAFGPGMFLAPQFIQLGDKDNDQKLSAAEFKDLANAWFDRMDVKKTGSTGPQEWVGGVNALLPPPPGADEFGPPDRPGRFGPGMFLGPALFSAADGNKDQAVTREEVNELFAKWFSQGLTGPAQALDEGAVRTGLNGSLPPPEFGGPGGAGRPGAPGGMDGAQRRQRGPAARGPAPDPPRPAGRGGFAGPGRPGFGGPGRGGPSLDPLVSADDPAKPLVSKLLAVPQFRARYLGYVRHMAENWLDWNRLGPIAGQYHTLIANEVKADTRKLGSFEDFQAALEGQNATSEGPGRSLSLKAFAEQRCAFLLNHPEVKAVSALPPR